MAQINQKKTIVLTGASDGIGAAAAKALTNDGHEVVVVGRSLDKTAGVARMIGADYFVADFSDLGEVRDLAAILSARYERIDVLANNAGGIFGDERQTTGDGHELTFQLNYLAPFLLTRLLLPRLLESKGAVINTSSIANRLFAHLDLDDLDAENGYSPTRAYGNAKLAQILFTKELVRRYGEQGLSSAALHPGVVATGFSSAPGSAMSRLYQSAIGRRLFTSPEKGADTLVWLAEGTPRVDWVPGGYYVKRKRARANKQASDVALARGLWERSESMTTSA